MNFFRILLSIFKGLTPKQEKVNSFFRKTKGDRPTNQTGPNPTEPASRPVTAPPRVVSNMRRRPRSSSSPAHPLFSFSFLFFFFSDG
jgi:hypothetical protein